MKKVKCLLAVLTVILLLAGCARQTDTAGSGTQTATDSVIQTALDTSKLFSDRDFETDYDVNNSVQITLKGSSADCSSDAVTVSGSTVTIADEGTYILSGTLDNGTIIVNAEKTKKIQLVLDNVKINSDTSAAIYVAKADKVFLTMAKGSENALSNGGNFTAIDDSNIDAAVFSKSDLTINGDGALTVSSPAGHGIVSKDDLVITGGNYTITAEKQGLSGKDSVCITDGTVTVTAGKDGIHSENEEDTSKGYVYLAKGVYNITADGDGISASNVLQIDDGNFTVNTGGGSETVAQNSKGDWGWSRPGGASDNTQSTSSEDTVSVKGIKASGNLVINNGTFTIDSADDALHSNASLTINGGTLTIATGDDGIHADETVSVTSGTINITNSYEGIEGQNISISGGTVDLVASDDGLNAAGGTDQSGNGGFGGFQKGGFDTASDCSILISGGTIRINAAGDGVDSNGSLTVTGGKTYVSGPTDNGNGPLDYNNEATISGGIFVAAGASGMAQNFGDSSTQGAMLVSVSGSSNEFILLKGSDGKELLSWTAEKEFACVLISCPEIKKGESYSLSVGNNTQNITMDSLIYGSGGGMGGFGGGSGGSMGNKGGMGGKGNRSMTGAEKETTES